MDFLGNRDLTDLLEERVQYQPDKIYLVFEDKQGSVQEFTYGRFHELVGSAATGFSELGIGRDDKVNLHLPNCPEFLICWFALARLGAIMVPSNTGNRSSEMEHVLNFSDAVAIVTEPAYMETFREVLPKCEKIRHVLLARTEEPESGTILFDELLVQEGQPPRTSVDREDVVEMIFTSGTTSRPKGVLLTHANCLASGERIARSSALNADERCLTALPLFHCNAQSISVLSSLTVGGTCILLEEYSAAKFWNQIRSHQATQTSLVAMQVRTLLAQPPSENDADHRLRRVFYAINVSDEEKESFEERFNVTLMNGYGLSEALTIVTMTPVFGPKRWPSIGLPQQDREVRIVDVEGNEVSSGEVGEIAVYGKPSVTLMKGYYKDPEATAEAMREGWLYTGDSGYMDEKGYVFFFDRKKDMIKRSGENVSASEVENVLNDHPRVAEAAVLGVHDPIRDEAVKAFVALDEPDAITEEDIIDYCKKRLAHFKVPTIVEFYEELPKTSIGKIEKKVLRAAEAQRSER